MNRLLFLLLLACAASPIAAQTESLAGLWRGDTVLAQSDLTPAEEAELVQWATAATSRLREQAYMRFDSLPGHFTFHATNIAFDRRPRHVTGTYALANNTLNLTPSPELGLNPATQTVQMMQPGRLALVHTKNGVEYWIVFRRVAY